MRKLAALLVVAPFFSASPVSAAGIDLNTFAARSADASYADASDNSFLLYNHASLGDLENRDTSFRSTSTEYRFDDNWSLRTGMAYDEGPSQTFQLRVPDANRYWVSAGLNYRWNEDTGFTVAVSQFFVPHSVVHLTTQQIGESVRGGVYGNDTNTTLVAVQLVIR